MYNDIKYFVYFMCVYLLQVLVIDYYPYVYMGVFIVLCILCYIVSMMIACKLICMPMYVSYSVYSN